MKIERHGRYRRVKLETGLNLCYRFTTPNHKEGFELFLATVVAIEDVCMTEYNRVISLLYVGSLLPTTRSCMTVYNRVIYLLYCRFTTPHHKEGFELFLDTVVAMEDVCMTVYNRVISLL